MAIPSFNLILKISLVLIFIVWTRRIFWVRHLGKTNPPLEPIRLVANGPQPKISVIIPAKDEEKNIANCLYNLFKQNYKNYEIIVVDDRSIDKTPHLLENFKKLSPVPFKIVRIEKLPPGWTGKNHAQFVGSRAAGGQWLLFTDADTTHKPESLTTAVHTALERQIDFLTLAPETESRSFWEKTVQPLAASSIALWFHHEGLANGQFILIKKEAYEKIGGNEAVKNEVVEDVALAKLARKNGFNVRFLNGTKLYSTRMYTSLAQIRTGWTRILTYLLNKSVFLICHKIFLFLFFSLLPFVVLLFAKDTQLFMLAFIVSSWIIMIRWVGNLMVKSNPWYAFLHPLGSMVMVWILFACLGRVIFHRPSEWRGDLHR